MTGAQIEDMEKAQEGYFKVPEPELEHEIKRFNIRCIFLIVLRKVGGCLLSLSILRVHQIRQKMYLIWIFLFCIFLNVYQNIWTQNHKCRIRKYWELLHLYRLWIWSTFSGKPSPITEKYWCYYFDWILIPEESRASLKLMKLSKDSDDLLAWSQETYKAETTRICYSFCCFHKNGYQNHWNIEAQLLWRGMKYPCTPLSKYQQEQLHRQLITSHHGKIALCFEDAGQKLRM